MFKDLLQLTVIADTAASAKGRAAFHAGKPLDANPFSTQTGLRDEWRVGWKLAARETAANHDAGAGQKAG